MYYNFFSKHKNRLYLLQHVKEALHARSNVCTGGNNIC